MFMLHESEEDGVEGILSLYDTPFGLSTYLAVDAASYDIRLRSTEIKMFSDNVFRLQLFRCCLVVTVPIHVSRRRVVTLLQYRFITEIKMFSDNVTVPIVTVYMSVLYAYTVPIHLFVAVAIWARRPNTPNDLPCHQKHGCHQVRIAIRDSREAGVIRVKPRRASIQLPA